MLKWFCFPSITFRWTYVDCIWYSLQNNEEKQNQFNFPDFFQPTTAFRMYMYTDKAAVNMVTVYHQADYIYTSATLLQ